MSVLPKEIIGLDIETTSLEPSEGEIIEAAAIRFDLQSGQEIERWERLARPRTRLTTTITALTGITNEMFKDQTAFADFRQELKDFIGDSYIFAHNANFDLNFLRYHGLELHNPVWDTFFLASVAWPEATSYNLGTLAQELGIRLEGEHRAAKDILLTWKVLQASRKRLVASPEKIEQINNILQQGGQDHYNGLFRGEKNLAAERLSAREQMSAKNSFKKNAKIPKNSAKILGSRGFLSKNLSDFSYRPEQVAMAEKIEQLISSTKIGLIEAGTGIGKTFAYLVPAFLALSREPEKRVIVSTYTRTLQDQLLQSDIPALEQALGLGFQVAILKGRRNYLCDRRLAHLIAQGTTKKEEAWLLVKIIMWLAQGGSGDLERLNISHQYSSLFRGLHADNLTCRLHCSPESSCPYQKARRQAKDAQILVVNHALLIQWPDISHNERPVLTLIIDEAHHIEEVARQRAMIDFTAERVAEIINPFTLVLDSQNHIKAEVTQLGQEYQQFLASLQDFLVATNNGKRLRLNPGARKNQRWQAIEHQGQLWLQRLRFTLGLIRSEEKSVGSEQAPILKESIRLAERFSIEFQQFLQGNSERIQWVEPSYKRPTAKIYDTALRIDGFLQAVWGIGSSTVLTSATLTTGGNFTYVKNTLGLQEAEETILPSSYNFKENMLIYIVDNSPTVGSSAYERFSGQIIESLALELSGRVLGLFTSHKAVLATYKLLIRPIHKGNIRLLAQRITGGRRNIAERFRQLHRSVLLGTSSFWEGIDIPGESLSCLVIPKLPFPLADDPILETLGEENPDRDTFTNFMVPQMLLRLRQGVGRLLRSPSDRGVVVILDSRITRHDYGRAVLASLPAATIRVGGHEDLLPEVRRWFGEETLERWRKSEG